MAEDQYAGITTISAEPPPEPPAAPPPEDPPPPAPWEAKLAQLERLTQQLQMDNVALRATVETTQRLRPQEAAPTQEPQGPPPRPQPADFGTDQAAYDQAMETWIDARSAYQADQRLAAQEQQRARQAQEQELARTQAELDAQLTAREAAVRQTQADYDSRAQQVASQMTQATYWAVRATGESAPDLVLHLAEHPEVLQRLNQTAPHLLGFEVGRLVQQIAPSDSQRELRTGHEAPALGGAPPPAPSAPVATRPPPPAPPQTVTSGGVVPPTGFHDQMSQAAYEAERRRQNPRLFRR